MPLETESMVGSGKRRVGGVREKFAGRTNPVTFGNIKLS